MTSSNASVKILTGGEQRSDDQILAAHDDAVRGKDVKRVSGPHFPGQQESPIILMALLQRLRVKDIMRREGIVSVVRTDSLRYAENLMKRNHLSGVPVLEGKRLFGVVSISDIIRALEGEYVGDACQKHMSTNLVVLEEDMPLVLAVKYFENYRFRRFPVLNKEREFVGIASQRNLMGILMRELANEIARLEGRAPEAQRGPDGELPFYSMRQFVVVRNDLTNAGKAANQIKKIMSDAGVDRKIARRVAVAAYELEINVCIHSVGGTITFVLDKEKASVIARDAGPGIADVDWACQDGTSTANDWIRSLGFGAGMGLANSKRVADHFEIRSKVPDGTTVLCEFNLKPAEAGAKK